MKNYKLKAEALDHTDLTKTPIRYTLIKKYVDDKRKMYLESEEITLERYNELQEMFGGNYYSH